MDTDNERERLLRAVERLAGIFNQSGLPRMPARVFAYALAEDADHYTAADLASGLRVSPAAISGAVRYLVSAGLLFKERLPGSRADVYLIHADDVWGAITAARIPALRIWEEAVADAARMIGDTHPGARRLRESQEFLRFMQDETAGMLERWQARRTEWDGTPQRSTS